MYDNIGVKLKQLALISFLIETLGAIILGIVFIATGDYAILGLLVLFLGPLVLLVISWFIYGFGELIDKTCEIARNTQRGERKSEAQSKVDDERRNKLEKLRSQGLITEEEYLQKISKI